MGQRSQMVVIAPNVDYGLKNPNTNKGRVYISHNQWRYGGSALIVLADFIKKLEQSLKYYEDNGLELDYAYSNMAEISLKSIRYAENHRINWDMSQSDDFENETKALKVYKNMLEFLTCITDNNNGWFFVKINRDKSINFGILNGIEESETIKNRTPEEYLKFFKGSFEGIESELKEAISFLKNYKQVDAFEELEKLRSKVMKEKSD